MKDIFKFGLILGLTATIAGIALAYVNNMALPKILLQQEKELVAALNVVLPGSDGAVSIINSGTKDQYYIGFADQAKTTKIGYAFLCESQGYSSLIRTLVGIDTSGRILAIQVLSQQETPGLGTRCQEIKNGETEPWFQKQFKTLDAASVALEADGGKIQSITGATITSRAITDGISQKAAWLQSILRPSASMLKSAYAFKSNKLNIKAKRL